MYFFLYSKLQDTLKNGLKSTYEYIRCGDQDVRITEKNKTGISSYLDAIIVHSCNDDVFCPIFIGYKKTKEQ